MNCLALDLGSKTGWAMNVEGVRTSGTWRLCGPAEMKVARTRNRMRTGDPRYFALKKLLTDLRDANDFDVVAFEDVRFSIFTAQTQLWSSLRTAIWDVFGPEEHETEVLPVGVSTLKKFATNHGGATKIMMAAWLLRKYPTLFRKAAIVTGTNYLETPSGRKVDDNEIDAQHLLDFVLSR